MGSKPPRAGKQWSFEEFCEVYCNTSKSKKELSERLGRTENAIQVARESIDTVHKGKATKTFPGEKWEDFVKQADNGGCLCFYK